MKNIIQDKRGDIPITILTIGVVALFIFSLVSYYISMNRTSGAIVETGIAERMNAQVEQYNFYRNTGKYTNDEIMNILGAKTDNLGKKYLYLEKIDNNKVMISIQYYPPMP